MSAPSKPASGYLPPAPGDECREFVVAFAEPLGRLGYLLTVGSPKSVVAEQLAVEALAQVRRQWRDVETTGTPELLAIEALLSKLPRPHTAPPVVAVARSPEPEAELDPDEIREAVWSAFTELPPRHRVPLVFVDASVASPRLAGLEVPSSYASAHRLAATFDAAMLSMRESLRRNSGTATLADLFTDDRIVEVLSGALRAHAADYPMPIDPYPLVVGSGRRQRRRAQLIGTVAVVAVVALGATMVTLSGSSKVSGDDAASASAAASHVPNDPETAGSGDGALVTDTDPGAVVDWPTRGTAALDSLLLANVKAAFISAHPELQAPAQVLLATDTSAFRVAYVAARGSVGVVQSWFYGPVGSTDLAESTASFGVGLVSSSTVLASGLVDAQGHTELVVIAPPTTRRMRLEEFQFSKTVGDGFQPLPSIDGLAVTDVPSGSVSTLVLQAEVGGRQVEIDHMPLIPLGLYAPVALAPPPLFTATLAASPAASSAPLPVPTAVPSSIPAPTIGVERGRPDPALLAQALAVAAAWHAADVKDGPTGPAAPLVVWGGTDSTGARLVVVRTQTNYADLLILEWSGDGPGQHGEYLLNTGAADVPLAFAYRSNAGTRIGVLASGDVASAALEFGGAVDAAKVPFDSTGFASLPLPATVHGSAANLAVNVQLYDATGRVIGSAPVPPPI